MSDQLFKGLAPKSKTGEEYFFYSLDFCYPLYEFIANEIDSDLVPYPGLDSELSFHLGALLKNAVNNGKAKTYYRQDAKRYEMSRSEISDYARTMLGITNGFAEFLQECGGCEAID